MSSNNLIVLTRGQSYPFELLGLSQESELDRIVCAVSLNCGHCIKLLPLLKEFDENSKIEFLLITNGTDDENTIIKEHLGFQFKIISFTNRDYSEIGISCYCQPILAGI
ncbi:hypothetical protein [Cohnella laeviribosi]|uniref:hypothetical protein n=1 Tax=Cohnella laeviribosi TaxID=380174 RepID=UPI0012EB9F64|nr:hypothetical protein [Cohnella laeviribosi]